MSDDKKYGRLIKNSGSDGPRKQRREARRQASKAYQEGRAFKKRALGGVEEQRQMDELYHKYIDIQWGMMGFGANGEPLVDMKHIDDGELWLNMNDVDKRTKAQRIQSQIFQQRAVFECFDQLRGGMTAENIIACVGMYVGMSMVNPEIRKSGQKMAAAAFGSAAEYMENHPEKGFMGMRGAMIKGFSEKRDKYLAAANDGRMPFTAESAALASFRLDVEYYSMSRMGRYDQSVLDENYVKAQAVLNDVASFDGVDMNDMNKSKRIFVGKALTDERHPERARMIEEMYEQFDVTNGWQKSEPHIERVMELGEDGKPRMVDKRVWTGEFEVIGKDGYTPIPVDDNAAFTVRKPYGKEDIAKHVANIMTDYSRGYSDEDLAAGHAYKHVVNLGFEAMDKTIGKGSLKMNRAEMVSEGADEGALDAMSGYMEDMFERVNHDLSSTYGNDKSALLHDMSAAIHLGDLRGTVADNLTVSFEKYGDMGSDDERILTARSVEMSRMSMEFVKMCGGIDPEDKFFQDASMRLSAQYATLCIADSLGIQQTPDMDPSDVAKRCDKVIKSNPKAYSAAVRISCEMHHMITSCGMAYAGALEAGNTPQEVAAAMDAGFDDVTKQHVHAFDYRNLSEDEILYNRKVRQSVVDSASAWAVDAVHETMQSDDFAYDLNRMKTKMENEKTDARAALVDNKIHGYLGPDSPNGPDYGE